MSTSAKQLNEGGISESQLREMVDQRLDEILESRLDRIKENRQRSLTIVATKGTLDAAYPPFLLSATAAALGWKTQVFFTFYGLELLKKEIDMQVSPLANPAMPMKMPFGPQWFKGIDWNIPNAVMSNVPGFEAMATSMMKKTIKDKGVASLTDLREAALEEGAELYACQMTVDLFGHNPNDFIDENSGWIGASSFLTMAADADVSLFI